MVQSSHDSQEEEELDDTEISLVKQPSSESKRQREGSGKTGAFGQRIGHSDLIFLEGILPKSSNQNLSGYSIEEQAERCFNRLESLLSKRGVTLDDVMKVEVQLTEITTQDVVDDVYRDHFGDTYPPRATVGVCSLPGNVDIQLNVIAADE
jgi:2-iminobutanoate/2-iminopropanoate deaminase